MQIRFSIDASSLRFFGTGSHFSSYTWDIFDVHNYCSRFMSHKLFPENKNYAHKDFPLVKISYKTVAGSKRIIQMQQCKVNNIGTLIVIVSAA